MTTNLKTGNRGKGRPLGAPNKTTADARAAIAAFVDSNAHRLTGWLDQVAQENPEKAFQLFQSVIEYHVPKLARSDTTTKMDVTVKQYGWEE
jgi:hypothetical protein